MTDALVSGDDGSEAPPLDPSYRPRRSHKRRPLDLPPARVLFAEDRQRIFADRLQGVILKGGILSLLTLTLYRFWMKTDQRRLIWQETRIDGDGFEYTGTPLELLIGSMIAIVILAVWFGIANLGLSFLQLAAWQDFDLSVLLAPAIASPLIAFAVYRARRYKLLRTRWRGIRFGMDGSALAYSGRWVLWTLAQILTLGLITPIKRLALERHMTRHMLYGDARFEFEPPPGTRAHLMAHWMLPWVTGAILLGLIVWGAYSAEDFVETMIAGIDAEAERTGDSALAVKLQLIIGLAVFPLLFVYPFYLRYKSREIAAIHSSRRLLNARCESRLTWAATFQPFAAYCGYWLLLIVPVSLALGAAMFVAFSIALTLDGKDLSVFSAEVTPDLFSNLASRIAVYAGFYFFYGGMILFSLWLAALIHFRRLHTYICRGTVVHNLDSVSQVKQRTRSDQIESEGFADALDIGGI